MPGSAGPGFTLPLNASFCLGYNGNLVASSNGFTRGQTYYYSADDGLPRHDPNVDSDPLAAAANLGADFGPPVIRFPGDYRESAFPIRFMEKIAVAMLPETRSFERGDSVLLQSFRALSRTTLAYPLSQNLN